MKRILGVAVAAVTFLLAATAALGNAAPVVVPTGVDAQALQANAKANAATAAALETGTCASERSAVAGTSAKCLDSACVIAVAALAALTPCAVTQVATRRAVSAPAVAAPPVQQFVQQQEPPSIGERIIAGIGGLVSKAFDAVPAFLQYKLGVVSSNNTTALALRQSDNGLAATQSTNNTFAGFGNNLQGTATAGFRSNVRIAADGFGTAATLGSKPTSIMNVTGNGNNTGSGTLNTITTTTTNNSVQCPAQSGPANGAPTGQGGTGPTGGASGGAAPVNSGPVTANCNAGK